MTARLIETDIDAPISPRLPNPAAPEERRDVVRAGAARAGATLILQSPAGVAPLVCAVGPVPRLQWLAQVQADDGLGDAELAVAVALVGYVNSSEGYAFPSQAELGDRAGVAERSARLRLANLIARGHVLQMRRGPRPSVFFLVLKDRQPDCQSFGENDRQIPRRSFPPVDGERPAKPRHKDRQNHDKKTGKTHFVNDFKSVGYNAITCRHNQTTEPEDNPEAAHQASQEQHSDASRALSGEGEDFTG